MSSSAALLDQDFGSESEDDNFNPAPADDSDNDAAGESDADSSTKRLPDQNKLKRQAGEDGHAAKEPEPERNGSSVADGKVKQAEDGKEEEEGEEEDGDGDNGKLLLAFLNMVEAKVRRG